MLVASIMFSISAGNPHHDIDPSSYFAEDDGRPTYPEIIWPAPSYIRDVILDPTLLDDTSIYDVHDMTNEARLELQFGGHSKCEEPTPLHYHEFPATLQTLYDAWQSFCRHLFDCEPFSVGNLCVGCAERTIRDSDVLLKLDIDPTTLYVVRRVTDELWTLVSVACVPRFWAKEPFPDGERSSFRFC